jgi:hypothetical protein
LGERDSRWTQLVQTEVMGRHRQENTGQELPPTDETETWERTELDHTSLQGSLHVARSRGGLLTGSWLAAKRPHKGQGVRADVIWCH